MKNFSNIELLEEKSGYFFKDKSTLMEAMTHKSFSKAAKKFSNNERLEYLGDSVLSFVVSRELYTKKSNASEGELSKERSALVCQSNLIKSAKKINLGLFIRADRALVVKDRVINCSLLANSLEALIGAIYVDGGLDAACCAIKKLILDMENFNNVNTCDYKSKLQEISQKKYAVLPFYDLTSVSGPEHALVFTVNVFIKDTLIGTGVGLTKKKAEKEAARAAVTSMLS